MVGLEAGTSLYRQGNAEGIVATNGWCRAKRIALVSVIFQTLGGPLLTNHVTFYPVSKKHLLTCIFHLTMAKPTKTTIDGPLGPSWRPRMLATLASSAGRPNTRSPHEPSPCSRSLSGAVRFVLGGGRTNRQTPFLAIFLYRIFGGAILSADRSRVLAGFCGSFFYSFAISEIALAISTRVDFA